MDLSYKAGTDAKCGKPMCCMNTTSMTDDPDKAAGVWGSYTCDLPYWTFQNMLEHIKEIHEKVHTLSIIYLDSLCNTDIT